MLGMILGEIWHNVFWAIIFPYITIRVGIVVNGMMMEKNFHERKGYHRRYPKGRFRTHV